MKPIFAQKLYVFEITTTNLAEYGDNHEIFINKNAIKIFVIKLKTGILSLLGTPYTIKKRLDSPEIIVKLWYTIHDIKQDSEW